MWLKNPRNETFSGDAEPGDFVVSSPEIGVPTQSLGNYIEAILIETRGHVATNIEPRFDIFEFVLTIRHSLIHGDPEEVVFRAYSPNVARLFGSLMEGNLYRLSTELKVWAAPVKDYHYYAVNANRPEPEYEVRNPDA
jgi:hypothetical protein